MAASIYCSLNYAQQFALTQPLAKRFDSKSLDTMATKLSTIVVLSPGLNCTFQKDSIAFCQAEIYAEVDELIVKESSVV